MTKPTRSFAELLRQHRATAGISQETLAERASMSASAVSALERGVRQAPWRDTVSLLATALALTERDRDAFDEAAEAARGRGTPASRSAAIPVDNLPIRLSSFVGRADDVAALTGLVETSRLVTVTGSAGIGKTRIALEVASRLLHRAYDEAWFVDLAPVTDGASIDGKIVEVVRSSGRDGPDDLGFYLSSLGSRRLLFVLDNCEHVLPAVAEAATRMLQRCSSIAVFATSRERLGIPGEIAYRLSPLDTPATDPLTMEAARSFSAVELFLQRALAVEPAVAFDADRLPSVLAISRRLGGIALAIELAAARLPTLGLSGLQQRLGERFDVLARPAGRVPARQQTLAAAIAWSVDLLDTSQRRLFSRLSIFANGWTLASAHSVCSDDTSDDTQLVNDLASLIEKSLVAADHRFDPPRFRLLEATRAYAGELLADDERDRLYRRLAEWCAERVASWIELQFTTPRLLWMHEIAEETDNVRASLAWAASPNGDPLLAARLAIGPASINGRETVGEALSRIDEDAEPRLAAHLWRRLAATFTGAAKIDGAERAIALFARAGDRLFVAVASATLAIACARVGDFTSAHAAIERALAILREAGQGGALRTAFVYTDLSDIYQSEGLAAEQRAALASALAIAVAVSDDWLVVRLRSSLAELEFLGGDIDLAIQLSEDVLISARQMRSLRDCMTALANLAGFYLASGDAEAAAAAAREALDLSRGREERITVAGIGHLAEIALSGGHAVRAARLLGYVEGWFRREGNRRTVAEAQHLTRVMTRLQGQLADDAIAALEAEGMRLSEDKAIAESLEATTRAHLGSAAP